MAGAVAGWPALRAGGDQRAALQSPGCSDETEFIKFWNIGVTTVSLAGWYMHDDVEYVFLTGAQLEMPAILPVQPAVPGLTARLSSGGLFSGVTPRVDWQVAANTGQAASSRFCLYLSASARLAARHPVYTYTTAGSYDVTLVVGKYTAQNGWSKDILTRTNYLYVLPEPAVACAALAWLARVVMRRRHE